MITQSILDDIGTRFRSLAQKNGTLNWKMMPLVTRYESLRMALQRDPNALNQVTKNCFTELEKELEEMESR